MSNEREKRVFLIRAAIRKHFDIDPELYKLINIAGTDLWFGPLNTAEVKESYDCDYPGFQSACERLKSEIELHGVWVDDQSEEVVDKEPLWVHDDVGYDADEDDNVIDQPEYAQHPEDWTHYHIDEVKRIVFGKELAPYV